MEDNEVRALADGHGAQAIEFEELAYCYSVSPAVNAGGHPALRLDTRATAASASASFRRSRPKAPPERPLHEEVRQPERDRNRWDDE